MGKTSKPLVYVVHPNLIMTAEIQERMTQGHDVISMERATGADLLRANIIMGMNCYRLVPETIKLLALAEKAERASKYGGKTC